MTIQDHSPRLVVDVNILKTTKSVMIGTLEEVLVAGDKVLQEAVGGKAGRQRARGRDWSECTVSTKDKYISNINRNVIDVFILTLTA